MKKIVLALMLLSVAPVVQSAVIVGVINLDKIINTIEDGKKVRAKLETEFNTKKKSLEKDEDAIKKAQEDYKKQASVLNEQARGKKEQEIQEMIGKIQAKHMDYQKDMQKLEGELRKPLMEKIEKIVEEVSLAEGVDITVEVGTSPLVFAKDKKDLNDKVVESYNKKNK